MRVCLLALLLLLVACGRPQAASTSSVAVAPSTKSPQPTAAPLTEAPLATAASAPDDELVVVLREGGLCPYGPCAEEVRITRGANAHELVGGVERSWALEPGVVATLEAAMELADWEQLRQVPFQGTCPTAYDGQKVRLMFMQGGSEQVLDSCEHAGIERERAVQLALDLSTPPR